MPRAPGILSCPSASSDMTPDPAANSAPHSAQQGAPEARRTVTHKRVLNIALPIMISNATVPILGAVDTGVVGQIGLAAPIGAVGIGAIILSAFYWFFGFLRMGTVGLTAQAAGEDDSAEVAALLTRGLMIGLGAGVAVIALQIPLFWAAFQVSPASDEVESLARAYMNIRIWSAPAAIALYAITGWLIAQERTRAVLVIQIWMNGLNVVLDLWFVLGLGWGVGGVALATFIAEVSGAAMGLWFCRAAFRQPDWRNWARVFDRLRWVRMVKLNSDILIRSLLLQAMFVSFLFIGSDMGDVTLAANQVLMQFLMITAYGLDGFAFAAEALVGRAVGAGQRAVLRRAGHPAMLPPDRSTSTIRPFGQLRLDQTRRELLDKDGAEIPLTNAEYRLLDYFLRHPGRIIPRTELLTELGNDLSQYMDRTIDVLILRLRRKIESVPSKPVHLQTRRGQGYIFVTGQPT